MATKKLYDLRRADLRTNVLENPYWITSGPIGIAQDDYCAILFSFPATKYPNRLILIHAICHEIVTLWAGGTITLDGGAHTIATEAAETEDDATLVDIDEYIPHADVTHGAAGVYWPDGGDYFTALQADTWASPASIVPADATVPCIGVDPISDGVMTGGVSRIHVLISEVPLVR